MIKAKFGRTRVNARKGQGRFYFGKGTYAIAVRHPYPVAAALVRLRAVMK